MFKKKYSPSIKSNNQLRDKVVTEINSFVYRLERGRYSTESDQDAVLRVIDELKENVEILSNTVGTGEEDIEKLANNILYRLKDLKKSSEQDTLHRIQEIADDLDFSINLWRDVLDGITTVPNEEEIKVAKISHVRKKLNLKLSELNEIKETFSTNARRVEKEIVGYEKDLNELDSAIVNEDSERRINDLYKRITALKSKIDSLTVRKSNYTTCFNLLDMVYVNAVEIAEASDLAVDEIGKAKAFLNISKLKKVLSEPDKALLVLKRMQADIKAVYDRTQNMDAKLAELSTSSTVVSEDALAYKAELMKKKRDKEARTDIVTTPTVKNIEKVETLTEEDE